MSIQPTPIHRVGQRSRIARVAGVRRSLLALGLLGLAAIGAAAVSGCGALGAIASAMPAQPVPPPYKNLAGHSVAVMVWVDRGVRIDYPALQLDLANSLQALLQVEQTQNKRKELEGSTFPAEPRSVIRFQRDNPSIEALPIEQVAPRIGTDRVIYVEVTGFATRTDPTLELFRGTMSGSIRVIEVAPDGSSATTAYREESIRVVFPPKAPEDGIIGTNDNAIYRGTVQTFARTLADRLVTHMPEED